MRKPFDLEYYLKHPDVKLVTGNGRKARMLCIDRKCYRYPILTLIENDGREECVTYTIEGHFFLNMESFEDDLFFDLPEHKKKKVPLTYEDLLERIKAGKTMWISPEDNSFIKQIIGFNNKHISAVVGISRETYINRFLYEELMIYNFTDGDPCWKEVEDAE